MKYAELLVDWLRELGYTHCFFVAGGNIMHLLDAVRTRMTCVPFVHEVAAGIAADAFNEAAPPSRRAFVLVTAGPGLTNTVTAIAGAWLESRELLVIGGQVKRADLSRGAIRQRGIQEIDGAAIVRPICVVAQHLDDPLPQSTIAALLERGRNGRKGPVFLEVPLDVQGAPVVSSELRDGFPVSDNRTAVDASERRASEIAAMIARSERPVLLLGGGVSRDTAKRLRREIEHASLAVMTTWNGCDRVDARAINYFGRPNTWGMRYANVLVAQADLLVAVGTRLGIQQTGFNWQLFAPAAKIVQVDIDSAELEKGHPRVDVPIWGDADAFLDALLRCDIGAHAAWLDFCRDVKATLPLVDPGNEHRPEYVDPYEFALQLSEACGSNDIVIPGSSGGAYTTMMQAFQQKLGQTFISNKGLAAMGYGLSLAIGASLAFPDRRTVLTEGDGGFVQNLQELATVRVNDLNLKAFIHSNEGYASIRMTQRNYFGGEYLGCDVRTGLGFPDWKRLFDAYSIPLLELDERGLDTAAARELMEGVGPAAFLVPVDPEQTYYPKISSRVTASGSMESAPMHVMSPDLDQTVKDKVFAFVRVSPP
jgi:acetolactate synthase I/II/III large subunit